VHAPSWHQSIRHTNGLPFVHPRWQSPLRGFSTLVIHLLNRRATTYIWVDPSSKEILLLSSWTHRPLGIYFIPQCSEVSSQTRHPIVYTISDYPPPSLMHICTSLDRPLPSIRSANLVLNYIMWAPPRAYNWGGAALSTKLPEWTLAAWDADYGAVR
jgi:hypothetical protein